MALSKERLTDMYRDMVLIRKFEDVIEEYAAKGIIPGFVHLSTGQEAVAAGVVRLLTKSDYKYFDHRGHGTTLMCGSDPKNVMAEIFGKETGVNGGRGGSMHTNDWEYHNHGFNGIQGSTLVTALGTAYASVYKKNDDVSVIFMGDGTLGEGTCHESMNMAAAMNLPVIYVLINNGYAISTRCELTHPQEELHTWADGYGVPNERIDGNDVEAVADATERALARARAGEGPTLIEFMTYRWQGHFAGDPAAYRPDGELEEWKKKCPIKKARKELIEREGVTEAELDAIDKDVEEQLAEMLQFSLDSDIPDVSAALTHVYADREVEVDR